MTLVELSLMPSILTGAAGGAIAGARAGVWWGVAGGVVGAVLGFVATMLVVAATGLTAFALGGGSEEPPGRPPGRLADLGFWLLMSPVMLAPVWVPFVTYRVVALVAGSGG